MITTGNMQSYHQTNQITKFLDKHTNDVNELYLYIGGIYCFTRNSESQQFSQGQLCRIDDFDDDTVTVGVLPLRGLGPEEEQLRQIKIRKTIGPNITYRSHQSVTRTQFPLRLSTSTTIHRCQGNTYNRISTKIESTGDYNIWDRSLFYVLMSRTRRLADIWLIGSRQAILQTIKEILQIRQNQNSYLNVIRNQSTSTSPQVRDIAHLVFSPVIQLLPPKFPPNFTGMLHPQTKKSGTVRERHVPL